jgi:hypothetical protein
LRWRSARSRSTSLVSERHIRRRVAWARSLGSDGSAFESALEEKRPAFGRAFHLEVSGVGFRHHHRAGCRREIHLHPAYGIGAAARSYAVETAAAGSCAAAAGEPGGAAEPGGIRVVGAECTAAVAKVATRVAAVAGTAAAEPDVAPSTAVPGVPRELVAADSRAGFAEAWGAPAAGLGWAAAAQAARTAVRVGRHCYSVGQAEPGERRAAPDVVAVVRWAERSVRAD